MIKAILVTIVFIFGGGEVTMTTHVETIEECEQILESMTHSVGKENVSIATCEKINE